MKSKSEVAIEKKVFVQVVAVWYVTRPPESAIQTATRSVQPFCMTHERDQQTDRQTDRPRYSVCSNRTLSLDAMRPNNITDHVTRAALWTTSPISNPLCISRYHFSLSCFIPNYLLIFPVLMLPLSSQAYL